MSKNNNGRASSSYCPKGGFAWLTTKTGETLVTPTTCKGWNCRGCRDRVLAKVKMQMMYGCLTLGRSSLITNTLRVGRDKEFYTASFVGKALARWWILLKQDPELSEIAWLKIPELTKKKVPHFHHLAGGYTTDRIDRCVRYPPWSEKWVIDGCVENCLLHQFSKAWLRVTGDSYIVDVRPVYSVGTMAGYLTKYLAKGLYNHAGLEELGYKRRYATSRNWPGSGKLTTVGTARGLWHRVDWSAGWNDIVAQKQRESEGAWQLDRIGTDLALALGFNVDTSRQKREIERILNVPNNNETGLA